MRLAYVTSEYAADDGVVGGLAHYLGRLTTHLAASGHDVHVFLISTEPPATYEYRGVTVHRLRLRVTGDNRLNAWLHRLDVPAFYKHLDLLERNARVVAAVWAEHRRQRFDLIQIPHMCGQGLMLLLTPAPVVLRASGHEGAWNRLAADAGVEPGTAVSERYSSAQFRLARHVFSPSRAVAELLRQEEGLAGVHVIPTPFFDEVQQRDDSVYRELLSGRDYLLYFGGFHIYKGVLDIVAALPVIFDRLPELTMVFVGADLATRLTESMVAYIRGALPTYRDRLVIAGPLPHAQLYPIIEHARLAVLPSLIDNLPNALLECMALGTAVLGTRGTSFDELIDDGQNGFLTAPGDPHALAERVVEIWGRDDLDEIAGRAAQTLSRLAPEATVPPLFDLYERVIAAQQTAAGARSWHSVARALGQLLGV